MIVITIVGLDIARTVTTITNGIVICSILEINLTVILACLPAYPALFRSLFRYSTTVRCQSLLSKLVPSQLSKESGQSLSRSDSEKSRCPRYLESTSDTERILYPKSIYFRPRSDIETATSVSEDLVSSTNISELSSDTTPRIFGREDLKHATYAILEAKSVPLTTPAIKPARVTVLRSRPNSVAMGAQPAGLSATSTPVRGAPRRGSLDRGFRYPATSEPITFPETYEEKILCEEQSPTAAFGIAI